MKSATCSRCGQEVRFGTRGSDPKWPGPRWLHRDEVDHVPVLGQPMGAERWEQAMAMVAQRVAGKNAEEDTDEEADTEWGLIPEPEMRSTPVAPDEFPPRSGIRQIHALVEKSEGWEVRRFTASRGPYVGAKGTVLSISDFVVLGAAGPTLDGHTKVAVAFWRDGSFDGAYIGTAARGVITSQPANSKQMKEWIRNP